MGKRVRVSILGRLTATLAWTVLLATPVIASQDVELRARERQTLAAFGRACAALERVDDTTAIVRGAEDVVTAFERVRDAFVAAESVRVTADARFHSAQQPGDGTLAAAPRRAVASNAHAAYAAVVGMPAESNHDALGQGHMVARRAAYTAADELSNLVAGAAERVENRDRLQSRRAVLAEAVAASRAAAARLPRVPSNHTTAADIDFTILAGVIDAARSVLAVIRAQVADANAFDALERAFAAEADAEVRRAAPFGSNDSAGTTGEGSRHAAGEDPFDALENAFAIETAEAEGETPTTEDREDARTPTAANDDEAPGVDVESGDGLADWVRAVVATLENAETAADDAEAAATADEGWFSRIAACVAAQDRLANSLEQVRQLTVGDRRSEEVTPQTGREAYTELGDRMAAARHRGHVACDSIGRRD